MNIEVRYFAGAKDAAGCDREQVACPDGTTVAALVSVLAGDRPRLARMLGTCRIALDDDFALDTDVIADGQVVYVLPPVSGGVGAGGAAKTPRIRAALVSRPVSMGEASDKVLTDGAGAVATFCGVVRNHSKGRSVRFLDYEAHEVLAVKEMQRICDEAVSKHGLVDAQVVHRIGHLEIGEVAVDIAASSAHRVAAFDGCRYVIEELKKRVPIWKKETDEAGSEWVSQGS